MILVAINVVAGTSTEHAQFYGGSMSFEIEKVGSSYKVEGLYGASLLLKSSVLD